MNNIPTIFLFSKLFNRLNKFRILFRHLTLGAFYAMKAMLSYYHCQKKTGVPLSDIKFMLAVPFVEVSSNKISRYKYFMDI